MSRQSKVHTIFLDEYQMYPLVISPAALEQITAIAKQNLVCQVCAEAYTPERPKVVRNTCLRCFMQSDVVKREKRLTFVREFGLDYKQRDMLYKFIDIDGMVYITDSDTDYRTLEHSTYQTLLHWGFIFPETLPINGEDYKLDTRSWTIFGNFREHNVIVLRYRENYDKYLDMLFFAYKGEGCVEINRRKKDIQRLFKAARIQLEATKDSLGYYHLSNGSAPYQFFEEFLYPIIADMVNREYTPPLIKGEQHE